MAKRKTNEKRDGPRERRTTMPRHVGISTKYVAAGLNDGHGRSLSITVAVEYRCIQAVSLGMPTTHKPATL